MNADQMIGGTGHWTLPTEEAPTKIDIDRADTLCRLCEKEKETV